MKKLTLVAILLAVIAFSIVFLHANNSHSIIINIGEEFEYDGYTWRVVEDERIGIRLELFQDGSWTPKFGIKTFEVASQVIITNLTPDGKIEYYIVHE